MNVHWKRLVLSATLLTGLSADATEIGNSKRLLNSIFVSFQSVDVFTADEIATARNFVAQSAEQGDPEAIIVASLFPQKPIESGLTLQDNTAFEDMGLVSRQQ